jgi:hypothetical protein
MTPVMPDMNARHPLFQIPPMGRVWTIQELQQQVNQQQDRQRNLTMRILLETDEIFRHFSQHDQAQHMAAEHSRRLREIVDVLGMRWGFPPVHLAIGPTDVLGTMHYILTHVEMNADRLYRRVNLASNDLGIRCMAWFLTLLEQQSLRLNRDLANVRGQQGI